MTISVESNKNVYTGNGSNKTFPYTFKIFQDEDLTITTETGGVSTSYTLDVDYTVSDAGEESGGNVVFTTAPTNGHSVVIIGTYDYTQDTVYTAGSSFPAASHEAAIDKAMALAIKHDEILERGLRFGDTYTDGHVKISSPVTNQYLRWGVDGLGSTTIDSVNLPTDHGALTGLSDDDHTQYHTNTRGDVRYYTKTQMNAGQMDTRYYTESEVDTLVANASGTVILINMQDTPSSYDDGKYLQSTASGTQWAAIVADVTQADLTQTSGTLQDQIDNLTVDHGELTGLADDDHSQYLNTTRGDARYYTQTLIGDYYEFGQATLASGITTKYIVFPVAEPDTTYYIVPALQNTTDSPPSIYSYIIYSTTVSGFSVLFSGALDSANYKLNWHKHRALYVPSFRGVFFGGWDSVWAESDAMDYVNIMSVGNATSFGSLSGGRTDTSATSNGTNDRGVVFGGYQAEATLNVIEYITISSEGAATDFGDMTNTKYWTAATSNGTGERGVRFAGCCSNVNTIDYITISTPGDATDFGDLSYTAQAGAAMSNGTSNRGLFAGGGLTNAIEYITINSAGDSTDFGDMTASLSYLAGNDNGTNDRGVIGGGYSGSEQNVIQYVTISSAANAQDFGDLTLGRSGMASASAKTYERCVFAGGGDTPGNTIDYITISTTGNAQDFGDLTVARASFGGCSNA